MFKFENKNNQMRYLFIILITSISFGQSKPKDLTEIHIYNIINTFDIETDPIMDIDFFEESYLREDNFLLLKTTDKKVVKKIYKSISQLRNYNKTQKDYNTHFGNERFKTMFVIKYNSHQDTLFYSTNTNEIYYKNYIVKDEKEEFKKSLSKEIIQFLYRDLASEREIIKNLRTNSISKNQILINNKNIFGYNRMQFEKEVAKINIIRTDSIILENVSETIVDYFIEDNKIVFHPDDEKVFLLILEDNNLKLTINSIDIKIGDSIDILKDKFNSSYTKWLKAHNFYNSDMKNITFFEIHFNDSIGGINFDILDNKISKIYIDYN
ncbi:hypothetical protein FBBAL38_09364 [Flavobacteria bacterium BAL38]|nr:hypothetical protein FBBAL38_09364 [Flavobacteria bacterium BAL38]